MRSAPLVMALAYLLPGCGPTEEEVAVEQGDDTPGPNRQFMANERFQDPAFKKMMMGKKGVPRQWSPDMMKKTPGTRKE